MYKVLIGKKQINLKSIAFLFLIHFRVKCIKKKKHQSKKLFIYFNIFNIYLYSLTYYQHKTAFIYFT